MSKKTVDLFGDDLPSAKNANDFGVMLNGSGIRIRTLSPGERFRGEVLAVSGQEAFISTGTPTDATLPLRSGQAASIKVGDVLDVIVVRAREGEILLKEVGGTGATTDSLDDAFDMELPVEGHVTEAIKGGFRVKLQGVSGFCPISQMDWRCEDPAKYVGRKFEFIITKWEKGRDLVVSRRKILEQERALAEGEFQNQHKVGEILTGEIVRLEKFGAFVRLEGGIEGLIPVSEISYGRIHHPQDVLTLGQTVQVKLMAIREEDDRLRLSLSLKEGGSVDDPWRTLEALHPVGSTLDGVVDGKENFGLFVRLSAGVSGLLPRSAWRDSTEVKDYENKRKGDSIKVRIVNMDFDTRRILLGLPGEDGDESWREHNSSASSTGKGFGTLGDLLKKR